MSISEILNDELSRLRADIIDRQRASGQYATGRTAESITYHLDGDHNAVIQMPPHAPTLQHGRAPGKVPANFREILLRWAQAKGITFSSDSQANTWAHFVMLKIKREGTALYRSGATVDIYDTPLADFNQRLSDRLCNFYTAEINQLLA